MEIDEMSTPKKTILIRLVTVFLLIVSGILYLLADRYLIEHVEIANVSAAAAAGSTELPQTVALIENVSVSSDRQSTATTATVFADDWNYQSDTVSIAIRQVSTGSGNSALTYFVADVVLSDATQLSSAFAKDSFGENIIEYTSEIASNNNAIFAINGDYYGFRSDGIVIRNGVIYRDIPARTGLAFYRDGSMKIYDETQTSAQQLLDAGVWNTLSFGPALIENSVVATNLSYVEVDTNFGNHSIQGSNPRTGIGIIDENHFVFIVVDGRSPGYSNGVTLTEFAQIFKDLGCTDAYNMDGGGSSTMVFLGRVVNNPLGKNKERRTSDILFIQ
jgi:exopolysaccharide biosynthesis protein